jgi:hypothetical protein
VPPFLVSGNKRTSLVWRFGRSKFRDCCVSYGADGVARWLLVSGSMLQWNEEPVLSKVAAAAPVARERGVKTAIW